MSSRNRAALTRHHPHLISSIQPSSMCVPFTCDEILFALKISCASRRESILSNKNVTGALALEYRCVLKCVHNSNVSSSCFTSLSARSYSTLEVVSSIEGCLQGVNCSDTTIVALVHLKTVLRIFWSELSACAGPVISNLSFLTICPKNEATCGVRTVCHGGYSAPCRTSQHERTSQN